MRTFIVRAVLVAGLVLPVGSSWAAPAPTLLNYQGMLSDGSTPLSGPQDMVFRFYATESGGAALLIDSHTSAAGGQVSAAAGTFHVLLGGGVVSDGPAAGTYSSLQDVFANHGDVYLETEVNTEILAPRVRIASAGFALNARSLDGLGASAFVPSSTNAGIAAKAVRQGATLVYEDAASVRIKPGILGFSDGKVRESTSDLVWSFGNGVGALGLDAGSEAADTWYYLYAVPDGSDDNKFTAVGSVQAPVAAGGTGPAGYAASRFIGSIKNDGSSNVHKFMRLGTMVNWTGTIAYWRTFEGAESPLNTWVAVDAAAYQPLTSRAILSKNYYDAWQASTALIYSVATGPPSGVTVSSQVCSDWDGGVCMNETLIGTIGRVFSWYASTHFWSYNYPGQTRAFGYKGYVEDLTEY